MKTFSSTILLITVLGLLFSCQKLDKIASKGDYLQIINTLDSLPHTRYTSHVIKNDTLIIWMVDTFEVADPFWAKEVSILYGSELLVANKKLSKIIFHWDIQNLFFEINGRRDVEISILLANSENIGVHDVGKYDVGKYYNHPEYRELIHGYLRNDSIRDRIALLNYFLAESRNYGNEPLARNGISLENILRGFDTYTTKCLYDSLNVDVEWEKTFLFLRDSVFGETPNFNKVKNQDIREGCIEMIESVLDICE